MNILVIGNGFDIAHGLKTKYIDFLNYVKDQRAHYLYNSKNVMSEFLNYAKHNLLIDYFLDIYEERCKNGQDGWVDFEREISELIQALYYLKQLLSKHGSNQDEILFYRARLEYFSKVVGDKSAFCSVQSIDNFAKRLLSALNELIRALEIYLTMVVPQKGIIPIKQIKDISVNYLLSFNYTDTFDKYYHAGIESCYIHGKAVLNHPIEECNLVLGIDEFQPEITRDDKNEYVWFKKFYQRIYKHTDSNYLDWIEELTTITYGFNDVYIYGHSLDVTDKDVLSKLVLARGVKTHIFYHNNNALAVQISNLVKIVGEENLIKMTGGQNKTIEFIPTVVK